MGLWAIPKEFLKTHKAASTLTLLYIITAFHAAADYLLPSVFSEVSLSFAQTPSGLGQIQGKRYVVSALSSMLAAYLVMHMSRPRLIALGTVLGGVTLAGVGLSFTLELLVWCWVVNSISVSLVMPAISSSIADAVPGKERGLAFGVLFIFWGLGNCSGSFFATLMAGGTFYGYPGWRSASCILALQGILIGLWIDSFRAIIFQGAMGYWPWTALVFLTMWLELVGFTHSQAAILVACFNFSISISGFCGGWIGDFAARHLPDTGRVMCAQFSAFMMVPVFTGVLLMLPNDPDYFVSYAAALLAGGLFICWPPAAANNPIFSEVVPHQLRTTVYAVDRMLEMLLSSLGPFGVGYVAEHIFNFDLHDMGDHRNSKNATSLGLALAWNINLPACLCALCYTWLYWTYPS